MTSIRVAAEFTEREWAAMSGPDERWHRALQRLRGFARRRGADDKTTETLAVALLDWKGANPYQKAYVQQPLVVSPYTPDGPVTMESPPFIYAWQQLVAQVFTP